VSPAQAPPSSPAQRIKASRAQRNGLNQRKKGPHGRCQSQRLRVEPDASIKASLNVAASPFDPRSNAMLGDSKERRSAMDLWTEEMMIGMKADPVYEGMHEENMVQMLQHRWRALSQERRAPYLTRAGVRRSVRVTDSVPFDLEEAASDNSSDTAVTPDKQRKCSQITLTPTASDELQQILEEFEAVSTPRSETKDAEWYTPSTSMAAISHLLYSSPAVLSAGNETVSDELESLCWQATRTDDSNSKPEMQESDASSDILPSNTSGLEGRKLSFEMSVEARKLSFGMLPNAHAGMEFSVRHGMTTAA